MTGHLALLLIDLTGATGATGPAGPAGPAGAPNMDTWSLIAGASGVVMAVMAVLALMSFISWYIIGYKYFLLAQAQRESNKFLEAFWRSKDVESIHRVAQGLQRSPLSHLFLAGYGELTKLQATGTTKDRDGDLVNVERSLQRAQLKETTHLESHVPFLATCGSAAPFIGLFGTVWGILVSFQAIGAMKSASITIVAPRIAEALIATAIGLVAAIPAVMAYNFFVRRIQIMTAEMETFQKDFLNIVRRHFLT